MAHINKSRTKVRLLLFPKFISQFFSEKRRAIYDFKRKTPFCRRICSYAAKLAVKKCGGIAKTRCDFCACGGQFINDVKAYLGNESRWGRSYILIKLERVRVRFFSKLCREGVFCATYPKQRVKIWMKSHFKFCAKSATIYIRKNNPI